MMKRHHALSAFGLNVRKQRIGQREIVADRPQTIYRELHNISLQ
jgi:hypothetical protein